ncbi:hypothetical protein BDZ89DRAFT_1125643 [Hymenopellis radicata]|nr:hypothetical protein BDZ89DRAFT_1125643 [Hymenopellis radicata]
MSSIMRFLQPLPAARRGYSSFFSSKPGGGRYFNSAKSAKTVVTNNPTKKTTGEGDSAPSSSTGENAEKGAQMAEGRAATGSSSSLSIASSATEDASISRTASSSSSSCSDSHSSPSTTGPANDVVSHPFPHHHPMIDPREFKLHQFFSLHRPLLMLSDPAAILRSAPPGVPLLGRESTQTPSQPQSTGAPSEYMDAIDADAETARQLNRALTMSRTGSTASWEATLRRLGLDVNQQPDRIGLQEQFKQDWTNVIMDSVRRKKKKKMKKHKRKKRRRLSRAQRQRERGAG